MDTPGLAKLKMLNFNNVLTLIFFYILILMVVGIDGVRVLSPLNNRHLILLSDIFLLSLSNSLQDISNESFIGIALPNVVENN